MDNYGKLYICQLYKLKDWIEVKIKTGTNLIWTYSDEQKCYKNKNQLE